MSIKVYVVFHQEFLPKLTSLSREQMKYITLYGVKERLESEYDTIYEYHLPLYYPTWQQLSYNEASAMYHIYMNKLYYYHDYVGIFQYDMEVSSTCFTEMEQTFAHNQRTIFVVGFFKWFFIAGQTAITQDYPFFKAGLDTYNTMFNTSFTTQQLIDTQMPTNNTFVVHKTVFEKMMSWLIHYYIDDISTLMFDDNGCSFNPGHMIEGLTSMFLCLEVVQGAEYKLLDIKH